MKEKIAQMQGKLAEIQRPLGEWVRRNSALSAAAAVAVVAVGVYGLYTAMQGDEASDTRSADAGDVSGVYSPQPNRDPKVAQPDRFSIDEARIDEEGVLNLKGVTRPDTSVAISADREIVDRARSDGEGNWRAELGSGLLPNEVTALQQDPQDEAAPKIDTARIEPDGMSVISGEASPNVEVAVTDKNEILGVAKADERGDWVAIIEEPIDADAEDLEVYRAASARLEDVIHAPHLDPCGIAEEKNAISTSDCLLTIETVSYDERGDFNVIGSTRNRGADIAIHVDRSERQTVRADAAGKWRTAIDSRSLSDGLHEFGALLKDEKGRIIASLTFPFKRVDPVDPQDFGGGTVTVQPGNSLWRLARRFYRYGSRYPAIFDANRSVIDDPDLIYPGQILRLPHIQEDEFLHLTPVR